MNERYDVALIGGSFSGAASALLLKRERPELRVIIVERSAVFDRKVGEATTEVSGSFLSKKLCLTSHLNHNHIAKQGLRFWFSNSGSADFGRCGELGALYQVRMPSYQVDREVLDQHVLDLAVAAGAELVRPAKAASIEIGESSSQLVVESGGEKRTITARWVIDASGRAAVLARKFGLLNPLPEHPTNSVWARFRGVKDLDGLELRTRYPGFARACHASRTAATNHLTGYGWWCWIIPLKGGDTSVGIVYDERLFTLPPGENLASRLSAHLMTHPVGRELFADAEVVPGDVKAYSALPYFSSEVAGPGWQIVGDAAAFLDPLYSAGLDFCSWTITAAVNRVLTELAGQTVDYKDTNARFLRSYHGWFQALIKDKYHYIGDAQLMRAAFLMDLGWFFFGPVRELCKCPKGGFERFPFDGPVDGAVSKFMAFANRRLTRIALKRRACGVYGSHNLDHRMMVAGFEPTPKVLRMVWQGIKLWLRAEWQALFLRQHPAPAAKQIPAPAT
ncbi:MAG: NAD(P)/FAD-dependent oxidoreductase [Verrucomicrobia bacterium]|nr:NAD(P)/FAD-dependent oxidoreductase [Verrucomicrobiota bacterium]